MRLLPQWLASRLPPLPSRLTVLSAAMYIIAFPALPSGGFSFVSWFCLVPWFFSIERLPTRKRAIIEGIWLSQLIAWPGFYWVAYVLSEYGEMPLILGIIGLFLFGFICQPQFYLFGFVFKLLHLRKVFNLGGVRLALIAICLALFYAGLDAAIPKLFVDTLGHSFYKSPHLRQIADLGGPPLLTFLAVLVNFSVYFILKGLLQKSPSGLIRKYGLLAGLSLTLPILGWAYGKMRLDEIDNRLKQPLQTVNAAAIQANIGDFEKVAAESGIRGAAHSILSAFFQLSEKALSQDPKPDFLVWPETAYPSTFRTPNTADELKRDQLLEGFVRTNGVPLLFGGYDRMGAKEFNSLFILSPWSHPGVNGEDDLQVYHKNILLLFGEYLPGADTFRQLQILFPQVGNFGRGPGPSVFMIPTQSPANRGVRIGPVICYEILFPYYVLGAARKGSQLIINITNDSWFGSYGEPSLHLALSSFRSIETRLPQLRTTNTGISALILPNGEIKNETHLGSAEVLKIPISLTDPIPTLMKSWGDWFYLFALVTGSLGLIAMRYVADDKCQSSRRAKRAKSN